MFVSSFLRLEIVFGSVSFIKLKMMVKKHVSRTFRALQDIFCTPRTILFNLLTKEIFMFTMQFDVCFLCYGVVFWEILQTCKIVLRKVNSNSLTCSTI